MTCQRAAKGTPILWLVCSYHFRSKCSLGEDSGSISKAFLVGSFSKIPPLWCCFEGDRCQNIQLEATPGLIEDRRLLALPSPNRSVFLPSCAFIVYDNHNFHVAKVAIVKGMATTTNHHD